jgi:hypothetical protein
LILHVHPYRAEESGSYRSLVLQEKRVRVFSQKTRSVKVPNY